MIIKKNIIIIIFLNLKIDEVGNTRAIPYKSYVWGWLDKNTAWDNVTLLAYEYTSTRHFGGWHQLVYTTQCLVGSAWKAWNGEASLRIDQSGVSETERHSWGKGGGNGKLRSKFPDARKSSSPIEESYTTKTKAPAHRSEIK